MNPPENPSRSGRAEIDGARVRQLFGRNADGKRGRFSNSSDEPDFIVREVSRRMAERLEYIKIDPKRVLDAGCGGGADLAVLRKRFPTAQWLALDFALPRLIAARQAQRASRGFFEKLGLRGGSGKAATTRWLCADLGHLPLSASSLDFIWSNLALHWHNAPHQVFPEWARALNVGGLVLFSAFGPDALREVVEAFAAIDTAPHVLPFTDMHDYGDMLVAAGFVTPVVDTERLTLTYKDAASLWRDVRELGGNGLALRRRGLMGRDAYQRLTEALKVRRNAQGHYSLSFEIIYGHAWKGQPRKTADGHAIVQLNLPGKSSEGMRRRPR